MDPEKLMNGLASELEVALSGMAKAKTMEEKLTYSKIVRNLTKSLEVFLDLANNLMDYDEEIEQ